MLLPASSYPIQGILYFIVHPALWGKCFCAFLIALLVALGSLAGSFTAMPFIARALIRAGCVSGLAWTVSVVIALLMSALVLLIAVLIIIPALAESMVDYVWREKGLPLSDRPDACCRGCATDCGLCCTHNLVGIVLLILTFPLNVIPIAGTIIFCYVNGWMFAWEKQTRYHVEVKGWDFKQSRAYAVRHWRAYAGFGMVCYLLQLIPIANIFFSFTNAVGAALWSVAQWQEEQKLMAQAHAQYGTNAGAIEASAGVAAQGAAAATAADAGQEEAMSFGPIDVLALQEAAMAAEASSRANNEAHQSNA
ncbi:etoposide-induced protein 2.4-domain-containing protein [Syncephalis pseudoplumigaleata]|uniref:Etoposide-induced protein 2.4-domain-containing protein n=1 Tax=Syncephalis pseudoplumigaleata TaxID=1712513 RepID=A0A4P9Z1Q2_9FUNG|nr:etoposide-induced protein 2.4-domain-containing protein [Syncephalis pseudoplumigaleata]|eukprot:RKP26268.1 etoposide-induced protein 2.4-domain-containing protein [Syncephalis pseudoplumigaleata]